jgi:inhibitor of cysteine peptidase
MSGAVLTEAMSGSTIHVKVDDEITLDLPENPTTGYCWQLDVAPGVTISSSEYFAQHGEAVGAGGMHRWILRIDRAGDYNVRVKLSREWLGEDSAIKSCEFTLHTT